jgi:hypothetical protein
MLDAERATPAELITRVDDGEVLSASANALGMSLPEAITWATDQLVKQQILSRDGHYLLSS